MSAPDDQRFHDGSTRPLHHRIGLLLLVAWIGAMTGFIGGIASELLFPVGSVPPVDGILRRIITAREAPTLPSLSRLAGATVDIFAVPARAPLPASLLLSSRTGRGSALTSDGWVVTVRAALPNAAFQPGGAQWVAVSGADQRLRTVDRIAVDPISDLVFLRVPGINATVIPFRPTRELAVGMDLVVPSLDGGATRAALRAVSAPATDLRTSDRWTLALRLAPTVHASPGTPVVDRDGALVGVFLDAAAAIPADAVTSATGSLFTRGAVERNILGLTYRDLAGEVHRDRGPVAGAVLAVGEGIPAVASTSPLVRELRVGDTMTAIGDDALTAQRTLPEILQEYPIGAEVILRVVRDEKARSVTTHLVTVVGAVYTPPSSERERSTELRKSG